MNIFFKVFMFLTLISSCRAHKISNSHDSKLYKKNLFYITFSISSNSLNPITMSGLGENLSLTNLKIDNTENFVRSFYNKYDYTPTLILSNYINITQCLGYKLNKKLENDFYTMISDSFKEVKIRLKDGSNVIIHLFKIKNDIDLLDIDKKVCLKETSIELILDSIKSIDKKILLVDKKILK